MSCAPAQRHYCLCICECANEATRSDGFCDYCGMLKDNVAIGDAETPKRSSTT